MKDTQRENIFNDIIENVNEFLYNIISITLYNNVTKSNNDKRRDITTYLVYLYEYFILLYHLFYLLR